MPPKTQSMNLVDEDVKSGPVNAEMPYYQANPYALVQSSTWESAGTFSSNSYFE